MTYENFDAVVKEHLYGTFDVSRAAMDVMRELGSGRLIHMTSTIKIDSPEQEDRVNKLKEMAPEKIAAMAGISTALRSTSFLRSAPALCQWMSHLMWSVGTRCDRCNDTTKGMTA